MRRYAPIYALSFLSGWLVIFAYHIFPRNLVILVANSNCYTISYICKHGISCVKTYCMQVIFFSLQTCLSSQLVAVVIFILLNCGKMILPTTFVWSAGWALMGEQCHWCHWQNYPCSYSFVDTDGIFHLVFISRNFLIYL